MITRWTVTSVGRSVASLHLVGAITSFLSFSHDGGKSPRSVLCEMSASPFMPSAVREVCWGCSTTSDTAELGACLLDDATVDPRGRIFVADWPKHSTVTSTYYQYVVSSLCMNFLWPRLYQSRGRFLYVAC